MRGVAVPMPNPYCAYLRVYEPLIAFDDEEREAWRSYAGSAVPRDQRLTAEHRSALAGVLSIPPVPVPTEETREAFVLEAAGTMHVCPVQTRLRSWMALGQFRDGLPDTLLHAFVPPASLERAEADHETWGRTATGVPLRILTATWSVPIHWFVPFTQADREERVGSADVVLRTRMSSARRRVARALRTLRRSVGEISYVDDLEDVGRWLEDFHPRSWLELDYGGLGRLLGPDRLASDTSVEDVATALEALTDGDQGTAAVAYRSVVERWAKVRALEHAN
ncbi:MAG: hypothetical protein ACXV3C_08425 [Actinomycetes bacterium]